MGSGTVPSAVRGVSLQLALVLAVLVSACTAASPAEPAATPAAVAEPTELATPAAVIVSQPTVSATPAAQAAGVAAEATPRSDVATATAQPIATQEVVRTPEVATASVMLAVQFESALNRGDVEGALALFVDGAEVKIPPDLYVGESQIRGWLEYLAANNFAAEPGFRHSSGDRVTWPLAVRSDYLDRLGLPSLDGAATLVARDGKIASYTFVLSRDSAARHRAAQLAASQVLQDPVIVGLTSANIYGFNDVFRDSSGKLISYRDVLTSEPGSGPFFDLGGEPVIIRSGF
jgi:hypothetical protein